MESKGWCLSAPHIGAPRPVQMKDTARCVRATRRPCLAWRSIHALVLGPTRRRCPIADCCPWYTAGDDGAPVDGRRPRRRRSAPRTIERGAVPDVHAHALGARDVHHILFLMTIDQDSEIQFPTLMLTHWVSAITIILVVITTHRGAHQESRFRRSCSRNGCATTNLNDIYGGIIIIHSVPALMLTHWGARPQQ